jgi:transcriptional regulator with XRE-family HTH domain
MNAVSDRIKKIKDIFELSNVELASVAGVTKQAVGQWINQDSQPSHEALVALREKLGVSDTWITTGKEPMMFSNRPDDFLSQLEEISAGLSDDDKESVLDIARRYALKNLERR